MCLQFDNPLDHRFSTYQVNIMQSCDLCGSYIWGMEKAYMCSGEFKQLQDKNLMEFKNNNIWIISSVLFPTLACKLICHKKCLTKVITDCSTRCDRKVGPDICLDLATN